MRSFKYRLYPTKDQTSKLEWTLYRCCEVYNAALQERKDAWNACKKHPNFYDPTWRQEHARDYRISYYDQANALPLLKQDIRPEYATIGAHVLQDTLKRVDKAFAAFFRRVRCGQTPGYPRYQSGKRYDSFCFPDASGWKLTGNRLSITNLGTIKATDPTDWADASRESGVVGRNMKVKLHRGVQGTIKTCTIKREGEHWYVVLACEVEVCPRLPHTDLAIGIDLGITHFATFSTADTIENPRYFRRAEKKLAKLQQALARKKRGSHRRKKAAKLVGACHRTIRNQRQDVLHKTSRDLVDCYEMIAFEKLKPKNMSRRPKPKRDETGKFVPNGAAAKAGLNKSIQDAGWAMFTQMVSAKAASAGHTTVVFVDPHNTSQICSGCKRKGPHKDLSERTPVCVHCGLVLDRDHNAAINILRLGLSHQAAPVA